jgi:hypothetical protein
MTSTTQSRSQKHRKRKHRDDNDPDDVEEFTFITPAHPNTNNNTVTSTSTSHQLFVNITGWNVNDLGYVSVSNTLATTNIQSRNVTTPEDPINIESHQFEVTDVSDPIINDLPDPPAKSIKHKQAKQVYIDSIQLFIA